MTPSFSRRGFRIVVFSAIAICAWTTLGLAISAWIFLPTGSPVWPGLMIATSLATAAGSIWALLRADFSGWRQAQPDLVRDSRQMELLAEAANVGLWNWDPKTGEVVFSNQWRRQIGCADAGIENHLRAWLRHVHPEDESRLRAAFQAFAVQPGAKFEATFRLRHHDGTWRTMLARGALAGPSEDGSTRVVGVQVDVTDRRQAEDERHQLHARLLESQKLESLGLLAGSIAHDFNNLLSGVLSNAELAELDLPEEGPLNARIEQIKQAAVRMADLSREMLAYSGRGPFNVTYVDLNALVREMSNLLTTGISKRVHLCFKFAEAPVVVEAEATQIRQVLMNLITNASDAMHQKSGEITLTTGVIEAHAADFEGVPWANELKEGSYAFFEVEDKGCGMTPETIRRMFEPFYTTKPHGRGLGLAAVQDIVRRHHGALRIRSVPGAGTTVRVLLPLPADMAGPPNPPPMENNWRGTGTILVVDDDETARDTAATLLAHLGFQTLLAADGDDALRCFQRSQECIRAVLLDATIPGLEGREVVVRLHAQRPGLPVHLTSGYSEGEVMKDYVGVRLNGFVLKPLEVGRLSHVLRESLSAQSPAVVECGSGNLGPMWATTEPVLIC
jgi:signal transduction histidine kinase/CheY-like chemotaxis protein